MRGVITLFPSIHPVLGLFHSLNQFGYRRKRITYVLLVPVQAEEASFLF